MVQNTGDNRFGVAKWIVDPTLANGTHSTIGAALTSATAGEDIAIRPGTYTEDLTFKAGVNLFAFEGDEETPNVTIVGKATATFAGVCSVSNIRLQTNSDFCLVVSGSSATAVILESCYFNATNNTAISFTSSNASAAIQAYRCTTNVASGALFAKTSPGTLYFFYNIFSQSTTTASTTSAGTVLLTYCRGDSYITTSSTADIICNNCTFIGGNATVLTHGGSGANSYCRFTSWQNNSAGSPTVSIGAGATLKTTQCTATNFNGSVASISGLGTLAYSMIDSNITTNTLSVSNYTKLPSDMGPLRAPSINFGDNDLANYKEGTFTPTIDGATPGTTTYISQSGLYTRIGRQVTVTFAVTISAATGTGNIVLGGLPFTVKSTGSYVGPALTSLVTWVGTDTSIVWNPTNSTTTAGLQAIKSATANNPVQIENGNRAYLGTFTYFI